MATNPVSYQPDVAIDTNAVSNRVPRPATVPLDNTGLGVAALGGAVDNLAVGIAGAQARAQAVADRNAIADTTVQLAQFHEQQQKTLQDAEQNGIDDPATFAPTFMSSFDDASKQFVEGVNNPAAQQFARVHLANLGVQFHGQALVAQAKAQTEKSITDTQTLSETAGRIVGNDESQYEQQLAGLRNFMNTSVPAPLRPHLLPTAELALASAANAGWLVRNPYGALQAYNRAVGMPDAGAPVLPPATYNPNQLQISNAAGDLPDSYLETPGAADPKLLQAIADEKAKKNPDQHALAVYAETLAQQQGRTQADVDQMHVNQGRYLATGGRAPAPGPTMVASAGPTNDATPTAAQTFPYVSAADQAQGKPTSSGVPFVDALPFDKIVEFRDKAAAEVRKGQVAQRVVLENDVRNQEAQAKSGYDVADIPETRFLAAYGDPNTAHEKFLESQNWTAFGSGVRAMRPMPQNEMEQFLVSQVPTDKDAPDFANQMARYNNLTEAAKYLSNQRNVNGLQALAQQGIVKLGPLVPSDTQGFEAELANRQQIASQVTGLYLPRPTPFTPGEAKAFGQMLDESPVSQKLSLLASMRRGLTDDGTYRAGLQQIRPDSPETAVMGVLAAKQSNQGYYGTSTDYVPPATGAELIGEGSTILRPDKAEKSATGPSRNLYMPNEGLLEQAFANQVGDAFRGDPTGTDAKMAYNLFRFAYAGLAARDGAILADGDKTPDSSRVTAAINAALGGVYTWSGPGSSSSKHAVVKPYGMPDDVFAARFAYARDEALRRAGYASWLDDAGAVAQGASAGAASALYPVSVGDGRYALATGTGFVPGLPGRDGRTQPLIVEVPEGGDVGPQAPTWRHNPGQMIGNALTRNSEFQVNEDAYRRGTAPADQ
jgi:hypothetical protein